MSLISKQTGAIVKSLTGTVGSSVTGNIKPGYNFKVTSMEIDFYLNGIKQYETVATNELITIQLKEGSTNIEDNPQEMWSFNHHAGLQTYRPWIIPANTQIDITIAHTNAGTPGYTGDTLTFRVSFNGYEIDSNDEELKKVLL